MAIARDTSLELHDNSITTFTQAYTVSATANNILLICIDSGFAAINSVTYAGAAMTHYGTFKTSQEIYYKIGAASGSNNIVVQYAGTAFARGVAVSYTGVDQGSFPDNVATASVTTGTSVSQTLTPVAANSWGVMFAYTSSSPNGGSGSWNFVVGGSTVSQVAGDSNGTIAGSTTMTFTQTGSSDIAGWMFTIAPAVVATDSQFLAFF